MELQYRNDREDRQVSLLASMLDRKSSNIGGYYYTYFWYLGVLGLGGWFAAKHGEDFGCAIFLTLALFFIWQNGTFSQRMLKTAKEYARLYPETDCRLVVDESGLTEWCSDIQLFVPWSQIQRYSLLDERLLIHFFRERAFIVPHRDISESQKQELISLLNQHNVPNQR